MSFVSSAPVVDAGDLLTLTLTVDNLGDNDADDVQVTYTLAPQLTVISTDCAASPFVSAIAAGASTTCTIDVQANSVDFKVVTSTASAESPFHYDPDSSNSEATGQIEK